MLRFSQPNTPAVQDFMNAQYAMLTDFTEKALQGVQKINELNIQTAMSMMEDSLKSVQQVMVSQDPYEAASITAAQTQPATEKLRNYQQQLGNIAVNAQAEWMRTLESNVPNASRAASTVADEIAKNAGGQAEQASGKQRSAMDMAAQGNTGATAGKPQSSVVQPS